MMAVFAHKNSRDCGHCIEIFFLIDRTVVWGCCNHQSSSSTTDGYYALFTTCVHGSVECRPKQ